MQIFFSYPHDSNGPLVLRLKADLEARGHTVWLDSQQIGGGAEWRRAITAGILASDGAVAFLSRHSVRDPGVCLNEIAIVLAEKGDEALVTVLVEPEKEVAAPVTVSHIQWHDMADWAAHAEDTGWYRARAEQLIDIIEHPAGAHRNAELEWLRNALEPLRFNADMAPHLLRFSGREWLRERYEAWLADPRGSRVLRIEGGPGMGKTAIASHLCHVARSGVLAAFLCDYRRGETANPLRFIQTLAYQLASRLPDYRARLLKVPAIARTAGTAPMSVDGLSAADLWSSLLAEPMAGVGKDGLIQRQALAIVVDGLDEATRRGRNELATLLAERLGTLPPWVRMVLTARPDPEVRQRLRAFEPMVVSSDDPHNRQDLRAYIEHWLQQRVQRGLLPDWQAAALGRTLLERCGGTFLYLALAREAVEDGSLDPTRLDDLPHGLPAIYLRNFERRFADTGEDSAWARLAKPLLALVMASAEPLPLELARELLGWNTADDGEELEAAALRSLGSLLTRRGGATGSVLALFHKSAADWLGDSEAAGDYHIGTRGALGRLAAAAWRRYLEQPRVGAYPWLVLPQLLARLRDTQPQALARVLDDDDARTSASLSQLADSLAPHMRYGEAASTLDLLLSLAQRQADAAPGDTELQRQLGECRLRLGDAELTLGHADAALEHFLAAVSISQALADASPDDPVLQHELGVGLDRLGGLEHEFGDADSALRHLQSALAIAQAQVDAEPGAVEPQRSLYGSLFRLARLERDLFKVEPMLRYLRASHDICRRLADASPDDQLLQRDLGVILRELGDVEQALDDSPSARQHMQSGVEIARRLADADPHSAERQRDLGAALDSLGELEADAGDAEAAARCYEESLAISQRLADAAPENAEFQRDVAIGLWRLSQISPPGAGADWLRRCQAQWHAMRARDMVSPADATNLQIADALVARLDRRKS